MGRWVAKIESRSVQQPPKAVSATRLAKRKSIRLGLESEAVHVGTRGSSRVAAVRRERSLKKPEWETAERTSLSSTVVLKSPPMMTGMEPRPAATSKRSLRRDSLASRIIR
jgi:hypothetical protein